VNQITSHITKMQQN